jgi:hypothetical protein
MAFQWRSWLGLAVALFLVYGALNLLIAIATPLTLQFGGAGAFGVVSPVMSMDGDEALLGRPLAGLRQSDPKLDALLVSGMQSMCAVHLSMATLVLGATWFGLRRGERWALGALTLSAVVTVPYYLLISANYAAQGAPWLSGLASIIGLWVVALVAFVAGLAGLGGTRVSAGAGAAHPTV